MGKSERIKRYRTDGGGAGLIKVEVLVPPAGREQILDLAARLRREFRMKEHPRLSTLRDEAISRFGAQCLWNMSPSATPDGMRVVAKQLQKYGTMDAWRLALKILEEIDRAA